MSDTEQSDSLTVELTYDQAQALDRLIGQSPAGSNPELYDFWHRLRAALRDARTKADTLGCRI